MTSPAYKLEENERRYWFMKHSQLVKHAKAQDERIALLEKRLAQLKEAPDKTEKK